MLKGIIRDIYQMMLKFDGQAKQKGDQFSIWFLDGHYIYQSHYTINHEKGCIERLAPEEMIPYEQNE